MRAAAWAAIEVPMLMLRARGDCHRAPRRDAVDVGNRPSGREIAEIDGPASAAAIASRASAPTAVLQFLRRWI